MSAYLWRLTDHHAVFYTDDRSLLAAALAYSRFPHRDLARATTYHGKNNRVFAWQFTFPQELWNGLVRHLGRAALTFLDEEKPAASRKAATSPPQPALAVRTREATPKRAPGKPVAPAKAAAPAKPSAPVRKAAETPLSVVAKAAPARTRAESAATFTAPTRADKPHAPANRSALKPAKSTIAAVQETSTQKLASTRKSSVTAAPSAVKQPDTVRTAPKAAARSGAITPASRGAAAIPPAPAALVGRPAARKHPEKPAPVQAPPAAKPAKPAKASAESRIVRNAAESHAAADRGRPALQATELAGSTAAQRSKRSPEPPATSRREKSAAPPPARVKGTLPPRTPDVTLTVQRKPPAATQAKATISPLQGELLTVPATTSPVRPRARSRD